MDQTTETKTQAETFAEAAAVSAANELEAKQAARPPRLFKESLPCKLTPDELLDVLEQIGSADADVTVLEEERKAANDGFKARIALAEQRRADLIEKSRTKKEDREVECAEHFIFATNVARIIRTDTGEIVSERALTSYERQADLPFEADPPRTIDEEPESEEGDISDPQAVLDGDAPPAAEAPTTKVKRRKRGEA